MNFHWIYKRKFVVILWTKSNRKVSLLTICLTICLVFCRFFFCTSKSWKQTVRFIAVAAFGYGIHISFWDWFIYFFKIWDYLSDLVSDSHQKIPFPTHFQNKIWTFCCRSSMHGTHFIQIRLLTLLYLRISV